MIDVITVQFNLFLNFFFHLCALLKVCSCKLMEQTEAAEHSCPWTVEEPHRLIIV